MQEFLQNYEIQTWGHSSRILRFLGLAVLLNFLFIFVLGQTKLLRAKACDGYFVGKICQALDALYVGSEIFAGNNGYLIREYEKTKIGSADQVTWIDEMRKEPAFVYPKGYFKPKVSEKDMSKKKNKELKKGSSVKITSQRNLATTSPLDKSSGGSSLSSKQKLPKHNSDVVKGELPEDPIGNIENNNKKNKKPTKDEALSKLFGINVDELSEIGGTNVKDKKLEDVGSAEKQKELLEDSKSKVIEAVRGTSFVNRKPLDDFADEVLEKWQTDKVDLSKEFKIRIVGALTKNGRLDQKRSAFREIDGDKAVVEIAKRAIESVGDSGWLNHLSRFDVKEVTLIFKQNDSKLSAIVDAVFPTPEKAKTVANGLHALMQTVLLLEKNGVKKLSEDEKTLLKAAKVASEGNILKINLELPKEIAKKMIDERLKEYQAKKLKEQKDKDQNQSKPNISDGKVNYKTTPDT